MFESTNQLYTSSIYRWDKQNPWGDPLRPGAHIQPAVLMDGAGPRSIQASEQRLEAGALGGLKTGNKKPETWWIYPLVMSK